MLELRPYQNEALEVLKSYWNEGGEHPLCVLATGTGKSLVQARLCKDFIEEFEGLRIISVTHVKELIEQNYLELLGEWPFAPAGIYSAGLGRRDSQSQILFCGIQSVHNKARKIGSVDLLMVDEAHLIPKAADTMYGRFIEDLLAINPDMRIVGFTATPYRTDTGRLDEGDERLFTEVVYDYGIAEGIADGFLSPLVSKGTDIAFDMSGVARRGGDYLPSALNAAVDKDETTRAAVAEIVAAGVNRKSWLVFCAGVAHAEHVRDAFRARGVTCEMVTGDTPNAERARILRDYKAGKIQCLTNNSVLTTGFNHPGIDLIADLRPTLSCVLYVQIAGRGTRPIYAKGFDLSTVEGRLEAIAAGPKPNCLYLDFSGNVSKRHGPVDTAAPRKPGEGNGEAPCKECPQCRELVHISAKVCPVCEFVFPVNEKPKHTATAAAAPILSIEPPKWLNVQSRKFFFHENAEGSESVRVDFLANFVTYRMWLSVRKAKGRCDKFWRDHAGLTPYPEDVEDWLNRCEHELRHTKQICVKPKGKYFEIVGIKTSDQDAPPPTIVPDRRSNLTDMDVPF